MKNNNLHSNQLSTDSINEIRNAVSAATGHTFQNEGLLLQAFTRASYANEHPNTLHNEVPELLGDSVLSLAVLSAEMEKYASVTHRGLESELNEHRLSAVKTDLVNKKALAEKMRGLKLQVYLRMSRGDRISEQDLENSVLEDLTEALIGAIYMDSGMDANHTIRCVQKMLSVAEDLPNAKDAIHISYRNDLQEWCQNRDRRFAIPVYSVEPDGAEGFRVKVTVAELSHSESAVGKNTSEASEQASKKMLDYIATLPTDTGVRKDENHVGNLQIYLQARGVDIREVIYSDAGEEPRPDKTTRYTVECRYGTLCTKGSALRKKEAKHAAAAAMLALLEQRREHAAR